MDKKLLKSLSNFATAIENLVEELKKQGETKKEKKSFLGSIFGTGGVTKRLKNIQEGIKEIKSDTKEILKNQEELKKLGEKESKDSKGGFFGGAKKSAKKITEGVGTIILIAGAVLAIGMAFKMVAPIDVPTILALSLAITLLGFTLAKLNEGGMPSPKESLLIGLALLSFAGGIVATSWLMKLIPGDISDGQFLTFAGITLMFGVLMLAGMDDMVAATSKMKLKSVLLLPLVLVAISLAIMASSFMLGWTQEIDYSKLLNIIAQGFTLAILAVVMAIPLMVMDFVGLKTTILGGISLIIVAGVIALSSHILAMGDYTNGPPLEWATGVGMSFLAFVPALVALGAVLSIPVVGALILAGGLLALTVLAGGIVAVSHILNEGDYTGGPSVEWSSGIGLAIAAFAPVFAALDSSRIFSIFGANGDTPAETMLLVGQSIIDVAKLFADNPTVWANYPTKEWATGVGIAISAFAPVYDSLNSMGGIIDTIFGDGDTSTKMKNAMIAIAQGIVAVGNELAGSEFQQVEINPEWASSVSSLITGFTKAYEYIVDRKIKAEDIINAKPALLAIVSSIPLLTGFLSGLNKVGEFNVDLVKIADGVLALSESIESLSESLNDLSSTKVMNLKHLTTSLMGLSVISPDNLSNVISTLSEKEEDVKKLLKAVESDTFDMGLNDVVMEIKNILPDLKVGSEDDGIVRLEERLTEMVGLLGAIKSSSSNISNTLNQMRQDEDTEFKF